MGLRIGLAGATVAALMAATAQAADRLPLAKGIYVHAGTPCKGASNASIISYWGGDNGFNVSQMECRIKGLKQSGQTYRLKRSCTDIQSGGPMDDEVTVVVTGPKSVKMDGEAYRWCGMKVQF